MSLWQWFQSGGFVMYPLMGFSLLAWGVVFEKLWSFRKVKAELPLFQAKALECFVRHETQRLTALCQSMPRLPTSRLLRVALERLESKDVKLRGKWMAAVDRERREVAVDVRSGLWILGTIASASPFVGLFGTVVGILKAFQEMAAAGKGGFATVASGISESLVATAAGIVVAVIASIAYNTFLTYSSRLLLQVRTLSEELLENLGDS